MLPCVGREHYSALCHRWLPMTGRDDGSSMRFRDPKWLVNIAHCSKLYTRVSRPGSGYWDDHLEMPWTGGRILSHQEIQPTWFKFSDLPPNVCFGSKRRPEVLSGLKRKSPPAQAHLFRHTVNKLAMDLSLPPSLTTDISRS